MNDDFIVGYAHGGMLHTWFHQSIQRMVLHDITHKRLWRGEIAIEGLYVAWSRNRIVQQFLAAPTPVSWLLMLDTDMTFIEETPYSLIDSANSVGAKIMSGWYAGYCATNDPGQLYTVWYDEAPDDSPTVIETVKVLNLEGPQELGAVGMGCCLIHRDALVGMREHFNGDSPWFHHDLGRDNGKIRQMGEDISFCFRAKQAGFRTWGDSRIRCGHLKKRPETWETFMEAEARR